MRPLSSDVLDAVQDLLRPCSVRTGRSAVAFVACACSITAARVAGAAGVSCAAASAAGRQRQEHRRRDRDRRVGSRTCRAVPPWCDDTRRPSRRLCESGTRRGCRKRIVGTAAASVRCTGRRGGSAVTVLSASVPMMVMLGLAGRCRAGAAAAQAPAQPLGPETFDAKATPTAPPPASSRVVPMTIQIDRYTPEHARTTMTDALKYNGYPGFLHALARRASGRTRSKSPAADVRRSAGPARCPTPPAARSRS